MNDSDAVYERSIDELMEFLDASPSSFHAAHVVGERLRASGFEPLDEAESWKLEPGGRYFVMRNGSAVAAVVMGTGDPAETGVRILGAHTDSPALKIKPHPSGDSGGYVTLGLEVYGGPVLPTWIDRDLCIAGRVVVADDAAPMKVASVLVRITDPLVTIPGLAIHLNRKVNDQGLKVNAQENLPAILCMDGEDASEQALVSLVAGKLGKNSNEVLAWDLILMDAQPAARAGVDGAYLRSGRLDDLAMCHASVTALSKGLEEPQSFTRVVILYDHEEVGSQTAQGAMSPLLSDLLERIVMASGGGREEFMRTVSRSLLVSADMAHALNPNHAAKHDSRHKPLLNAGPVLKLNASMKYATDATGWAVFERACSQADVPVQRYVNRSDLPCGSTIGPLASSRLGIKTIDVGNPMLSMHSIRETVGCRDHELMIRALEAFLAGA